MKGKRIKVLFIEDNPGDAMLIQEKLAARRPARDLSCFEIEHVERLQRALARLGAAARGEKEAIDVVISGLGLPESATDETVATLRQYAPDIPLVVLTGREDEGMAQADVRAGVDDCLHKDEVTGSLLARTMMYAIERQRLLDRLEQRAKRATVEMREGNEDVGGETAGRVRTEQKVVEEACAVCWSEARTVRILNALPQAIAYVDKDLKHRFVNRAYAEKSGLELDDVVGKTLPEVIGEEPFEQIRPCVEEALQGERVLIRECFNCAAGGKRVIDGVLEPDVAEAGGLRGFYAVLSDVTPYVEMEEALQDCKARYSAISEIAFDLAYAVRVEPDGTLALEWKTKPLYFLTGRFRLDTGSISGWRNIVHAEDRGIADRHFQTLLSGEPDEVELRVVTRSGETRWLHNRGQPIWDESEKRVVRIIGATKEITERKRAEKALRERTTRLEMLREGPSGGTCRA
jgi:PAS domain S-box-containing protein